MFYSITCDKLQQIKRSVYSYCSDECNLKFDKNIDKSKLICDCGNDIKIYEWLWKSTNLTKYFILESNDLEVLFHPTYSSGTSIARGIKCFQKNLHYYWELKMTSLIYGTDVMVGIGTTKTEDYSTNFCSMLGNNDQSWGYSFKAFIQHNKLRRMYGKKFNLGSIVGVHLDMYNGTIEFYLNRKPLGIAFTHLKDKELYPMICSTAAKSSIKLNCAISQEQTLQMLCLRCIQQQPKLLDTYNNIPGLHKYYERKYFWIKPPEITKSKSKIEENDELDLINCCSSKSYGQKRLSDDEIHSTIKKFTKNGSNHLRLNEKDDESSVPSILYDDLDES